MAAALPSPLAKVRRFMPRRQRSVAIYEHRATVIKRIVSQWGGALARAGAELDVAQANLAMQSGRYGGCHVGAAVD